MIKKKKFCGILQETLIQEGKKFMIVGIGINIKKSPYIADYPTCHINEFSNKDWKTRDAFTSAGFLLVFCSSISSCVETYTQNLSTSCFKTSDPQVILVYIYFLVLGKRVLLVS